ncbi:hypothetical protein CFC21_096903, partial [Triticum aestivum]
SVLVPCWDIFVQNFARQKKAELASVAS